MNIFSLLNERWIDSNHPFLINEDSKLFISDLIEAKTSNLENIKCGDIVVLIGDFNPISISTLFKLINIGAIIAPLTSDTISSHDYFFKQINPDWIIENNDLKKVNDLVNNHPLVNNLRDKSEFGFIFFSSGTGGKPKAILHSGKNLLKKYLKTSRPLKALNFLMFDHLGGINTFFHIVFNCGTIIGLKKRTIKEVLHLCEKHQVELLPTTPTFLRMLLLSELVPDKIPKSIKIISYGTELMDESTLKKLCVLLPNIEFRQTYGLSEFNAFRIKGESRGSLYFKFDTEEVQTKIIDDILYLKSKFAMLGYINANSPFDNDGWFKTNDIIEKKNNYIKIVGRDRDLINVGGLKFMAADVEKIALSNPIVANISIISKKNPITGNHVEAIVELKKNEEKNRLKIKKYFREKLPSHMMPQKISFDKIKISNRFKKK